MLSSKRTPLGTEESGVRSQKTKSRVVRTCVSARTENQEPCRVRTCSARTEARRTAIGMTPRFIWGSGQGPDRGPGPEGTPATGRPHLRVRGAQPREKKAGKQGSICECGAHSPKCSTTQRGESLARHQNIRRSMGNGHRLFASAPAE